MSDDMLVLIGDDEAAMLGRRSDGGLTLAYLPECASRPDATPLSRSLDRLRTILRQVPMALTTAAGAIRKESGIDLVVDWEQLLGKYHPRLRIKAAH